MVRTNLVFEIDCVGAVTLVVKNFLEMFGNWYQLKLVNSDASIAGAKRAGGLLVLFAKTSSVFNIEKQLKNEQIKRIDCLLWDDQQIYALACFVRKYFPSEQHFFRGVFFIEMDRSVLAGI